MKKRYLAIAVLSCFIITGCHRQIALEQVEPIVIDLEEKMTESTSTPTPTPTINPLFDNIDAFINNEVEQGFPGAVLLVAKNGEIIHHQAYGYARKYNQKELMQSPTPMHKETLFDLASLTKLYATTFAVMKLISDEKLSLDDTLGNLIKQYNKEETKDITVRMLLRHFSGFPAHISFYKESTDELYSRSKEETYKKLSQVALANQPNTKQKYSDIGYMILGQIVESVSKISLDQYISSAIYEPMQLQEDCLMFTPLEKGIKPSDIAATERMGNTRDGAFTFEGVRTYTLQGEVHDEKAYYSMNEVSGHAGLFGNAYGVEAMNELLLNKGIYNGKQILKEEIVNTFLNVYDDNKYQLGFRLASTYEDLQGVVPETAFLNTGWTGTASYIDTVNNLSIIILTNKRHSPCQGDNFEGNDLFKTGKYTEIIKMVYDAIEEH